MAEHTTTIAPNGNVTFTPDHPLDPGVCGWTGRPLTLEEEVGYAAGEYLGDVQMHEGGHHLVLSYCQFAGGEGATVHVANEPPTIETRPPDGE